MNLSTLGWKIPAIHLRLKEFLLRVKRKKIMICSLDNKN